MESSWRDFVDGAICPMTSPALTPWMMRLIENCSDLSPNVSLMSCVKFSKRSQPPYVPLELGRITLSCLEMYKIRYFLTVKYFMKYFGNIYVFNEIFQNATSLCPTCFFLSQGATAHI